MPFVVFAAPWFSENAARFIQAAVSLPDVRVAVVSQDPWETAPPHVREGVVGHWRVDDVFDSGQLAHAAGSLSARFGPLHRLYGAYEQLQVPLAEARARLGVEGMSVEAAQNFRDKARMKAVLREAGVPCARYRLVADEAEAWPFAEEVGYPLVVKPPAGAGSQSTYRVDNAEALGEALRLVSPSAEAPTLLEEFITGEEHSFETISIGGRAVWHSLTHYYPTPLDVMRNPWIQWCVVLPREVDGPQYDDIRGAAVRALEALGMDTGLTPHGVVPAARRHGRRLGGRRPPARRADHDARLARQRHRLPTGVGARHDPRRVRGRPSGATRRAPPSCAGRGAARSKPSTDSNRPSANSARSSST